MKKEKKKLSLKERENKKLKRKKIIAKIINIIIWVYAIGVSLVLVVGSCSTRVYSGASAESTKYDVDNIIVDLDSYDSNVEYRFYVSGDFLQSMNKYASYTSGNEIIGLYGSEIFNGLYVTNSNVLQQPRIVSATSTQSYTYDLIISDDFIYDVDSYGRLRFNYLNNDYLMLGVRVTINAYSNVASYYYLYTLISSIDYDNESYLISYKQFARVTAQTLNFKYATGGYVDGSLFKAFKELMCGKYYVNTYVNSATPQMINLRTICLSMFTQYGIHNLNVSMPKTNKGLVYTQTYAMRNMTSFIFNSNYYYTDYVSSLLNQYNSSGLTRYIISIIIIRIKNKRSHITHSVSLSIY